jgi:uncharacterized protein (TIGR02588 family)
MTTSSADKRPSETDEPSWVEWATGILSAILVVMLIGWIAWEALTAEDEAPKFAVAITERKPVEGGYRVTFEITNTAARTASAVTVRGEILESQNILEDAEVTFDYVPARSKSSGAMLFSKDPGQAEIRVRAVGYTEP